MENSIKIDDLGVPPFWETSKCVENCDFLQCLCPRCVRLLRSYIPQGTLKQAVTYPSGPEAEIFRKDPLSRHAINRIK